MNTIKTIDNTKDYITKILNEKDKEVARLTEIISGEEEAVAAANHDMEDATSAGDVIAYKNAKARRQEIIDAKEMHENRLEAFIEKPLISKQEYEKTVASIFAEVATIDNQTKETLCKLSNEMNDAANKLQEVITRANSVLKSLQHDVYRDADRSRNPKSNEMMFLAHEEKAVQNYETVLWGRSGVNTFQYASYTGKKGI